MATTLPVPVTAPLLEPLERRPSTISLPTGFVFRPVPIHEADPAPVAPSLGPLAAFVGDWTGSGFNTIFRPDSQATPTPLPTPVSVTPPFTKDNILELNLTTENLSFSAALGIVPNRGTGTEADAFLNGVPYLQAITDVTVKPNVGIHLEPGMWVIVPKTTSPAEGVSLVRMASIPHGTTIQAQGTSTVISGAPTIPAVDITPSTLPPAPFKKITFPSQTFGNKATLRLPQDLTPFQTAGTITPAILADPNTVLRNHLIGQTITSTTVLSISTTPAAPLTGGGTDNIGFLNVNAKSASMSATFWIETVKHTIVVGPFRPGQPPILIKGTAAHPGTPVPTFSVTPPFEITTPRTITVFSTQIQYSQTVNLDFAGLSWPHVSVATLTPATSVVVPPSAWT